MGSFLSRRTDGRAWTHGRTWNRTDVIRKISGDVWDRESRTLHRSVTRYTTPSPSCALVRTIVKDLPRKEVPHNVMEPRGRTRYSSDSCSAPIDGESWVAPSFPCGTLLFMRNEEECCMKECRFLTNYRGIHLDAHRTIATSDVSHA